MKPDKLEERILEILWLVCGYADEFRFNRERGLEEKSWVKYHPDRMTKSIMKLIQQERQKAVSEVLEVVNQTIFLLQIMAVELAYRQKDDKAAKIIRDIRGKYDELVAKIKKDIKK